MKLRALRGLGGERKSLRGVLVPLRDRNTPLEVCAIVCVDLGRTGRWMRLWMTLSSGLG